MVENKKKPKWGKPKLIVLVRGKPEEGVLAACKYWSGAGPRTDYGTCLGASWEPPALCMAFTCMDFPPS
jgi:hypothetical protein